LFCHRQCATYVTHLQTSQRFFFFSNRSSHHLDLHSFPTRRSSDLPGIPEEQRSRLFDRFWQARGADRRGLGLGLAIAKGIAEAQDRKSTRLNSSHVAISYAVFCLKKKK